MGNRYKYRGMQRYSSPLNTSLFGSIWTPAALFAQGQQGVWYEPKPEYLFQDAAGTIPVENDGDPVGLRLDLSGNGNHQAAPTSADRPIYRTDGTRHWIEPNGVNHTLVSINNVPWLTSSTAAAFTFSRLRRTGGQAYYMHCDGNEGTQAEQSFSVLLDIRGDDRQIDRQIVGGKFFETPGLRDVDRYVMVQFDKSAGTGVAQWDAYPDEQSFTPGTVSRTDQPMRSYSRGPNSVNFQGRDYGFLAVAETLSPEDRQRAKDYMESL